MVDPFDHSQCMGDATILGFSETTHVFSDWIAPIFGYPTIDFWSIRHFLPKSPKKISWLPKYVTYDHIYGHDKR